MPQHTPGDFEVKSREDGRRNSINCRDVVAVTECANPKDGVKVYLRGIGFFQVEDPYDDVIRLKAAAYEELLKTDRGY